MKRCLVLFVMLVSAGASLWAAGAKHSSTLMDLGVGWHGSLQFDTLLDTHRVFEVGSMGFMDDGPQDFLGELNANERVKTTARTGTSSIAISMGMRQMLREKLGWSMTTTFFFPLRRTYTLETTMGSHSDSEKESLGFDDFYSPLGGDFVIGLVYMPIRNFRWDLSVTHGLHLNFVNASTSQVALLEGVVGLATEVSADFYFKNEFYLNCGVVLTYDFYSFADSRFNIAGRHFDDSRHGATTYISCRPKIAIGRRIMEYY